MDMKKYKIYDCTKSRYLLRMMSHEAWMSFTSFYLIKYKVNHALGRPMKGGPSIS